ncbi:MULTISPECIES: glycosyltransferase [unclassified Luteococcus]|uniref:glycosyltransferase n=1 Tax=unclassified Luteococcus TaxID=2639923 RepID=UPI00313A7A7E
MTRIVIITRAFPWLPGEQFVEPEAPYWAREDAEVIVMPWHMDGEPRPLPDGVRVDDCINRITPAQRKRARLRALGHPLLRRELLWLARHRRLNRATATEVVRSVGGALAHRDALAAWIAQHGPIDVVYTYWWDVWTYGAQLLKGAGVGHVVTRAHGRDLYESRHPSGYLGLKRLLGPQLDAQLAISTDGRRTVIEQYGLPPRIVQLSPLGVELPAEPAPSSPDGELHLLSTAQLYPVKRVDRLVDALELLCRQHPELQVRWTHFGAGELFDDLQARVQALAGLPNLHVRLPGSVDNATVRQHLHAGPVDLFVNTSESEGVPVSIMEAMAFGVPSLAPAVGGIPDLVPAAGPGGELLSAAPDGAELADALWRWHGRAKDPAERAAARKVVADGHDQARNYPSLMAQLVALAGTAAGA